MISQPDIKPINVLSVISLPNSSICLESDHRGIEALTSNTNGGSVLGDDAGTTIWTNSTRDIRLKFYVNDDRCNGHALTEFRAFIVLRLEK